MVNKLIQKKTEWQAIVIKFNAKHTSDDARREWRIEFAIFHLERQSGDYSWETMKTLNNYTAIKNAQADWASPEPKKEQQKKRRKKPADKLR